MPDEWRAFFFDSCGAGYFRENVVAGYPLAMNSTGFTGTKNGRYA
jgi:hypothetical protein